MFYFILMEVIMSITCVSEFPCAPGKIDELIKIFHEALPLARTISGCEKIYFSISETNPNVAVTFAIWNSETDHEKYVSQLTVNGTLADIKFCLSGFPKFNFFNNFDNF
jgi:quinol monooxygenase YgiN